MNATARQIQSQRWRRTFLSPFVLIPALIGIASFGAAAIIGGGVCTTIGIVGLGAAAAVAAYRATVGSTAILQQARLDLLHQKQRTHLEYLRNLRRKMRRDRDPRTGDLVTKLRSIYQHIEQSADVALADYSGVLPQVHEQARELYDSCLKLLEHSFELWDTGRDLTDKSNRESLAAEREKILGEVQQSVDHLDRTMDELRKASLRHDRPDGSIDAVGATGATGEQAHLRDELSRGIETARAVEQRMVELEQDLGLRSRH